MPMERERYPADWERIATAKKESVGWKCERCGKQCRKPGEPFDTHRNTLTVAHLNHIPEDVRPENLCAMCAPCHLKYDAQHHAETRRKNMRLIDAQAVRHAVCNVDIPNCVTEEQFAAVLGNVCEALQMLPTIDAVSIKAISAWLAGYAAPPNYALEAICNDIDPASIVYTANDRARAWEYHWQHLIDCGLLQEDEHGETGDM